MGAAFRMNPFDVNGQFVEGRVQSAMGGESKIANWHNIKRLNLTDDFNRGNLK
jgi:hypothetical protein